MSAIGLIRKFRDKVFPPGPMCWCCEVCRREVHLDQKFCGFCGAVQTWLKCPSCNQTLDITAEKYCTHCGAKVEAS